MKITLLFATHNGEKSLPRMLDALRGVDYPIENYDIIAVNNNSTDETQSILEGYKKTLPLTVIFEKNPGKSSALNAGLDHVPEDTDLIILTDDDVIADPEWFSALVQAAKGNPEYDIFGGEIRPAWDMIPDPWIFKWVNLKMVFALNEGFPEGAIRPGLIFGPNSAFRAHLLLNTKHRFIAHIGPRYGQSYPMGNDTALSRLLCEKGHKAYHVSQAVVSHIIPIECVSEDWIIRRAERYGWGRALQNPDSFSGYRVGFFMPLRRRFEYLILYCLHYPVKALPHSWLRYKILYGYYYYKGIYKGIKQ